MSSPDNNGIDADLEAGIIAGKRRQTWIVVVALAVVVALVIVGLVIQRSRPSVEAGPLPRRVVWTFQGFDGVRTVPLNSALEEQLREAGLQPLIPAPEPPTGFANVNDLVPWASEHEAAHALLISVELLEERQGLGGEARFVVARFTARVRSQGGDSDEPAPTSVTLAGQDTTTADALEELGTEAIRLLGPDIVTALIRSGPIDAIVEDGSSRALNVMGKLAATWRAAGDRQANLAELADACERADTQLRRDLAGGERCLSKACETVRPVGLLPDGSGAVVQVSASLPDVRLDHPAVIGWASATEKIALVGLDDGDERTLALVSAISGGAALTSDGSKVFFIEEAGAFQGLVSVEIASGERRVHKVVEAPERLEHPVPSPDGRWVAYLQPMDRRNPQRDFLLTLADGQLRELPAGTETVQWVELSGQTLLAIKRLGRVGEPSLEPVESPEAPALRRHIALLDPETLEIVRTIWDSERPVLEIAGARNDALVFTYLLDGMRSCGFARYQWASTETIDLELGCARNVSLVADHEILGLLRVDSPTDGPARGVQVAAIDARTGQHQILSDVQRSMAMAIGRPGSRVILRQRTYRPPYRDMPDGVLCAYEMPPMTEPAAPEAEER
jgi:hypothetical protein